MFCIQTVHSVVFSWEDRSIAPVHRHKICHVEVLMPTHEFHRQNSEFGPPAAGWRNEVAIGHVLSAILRPWSFLSSWLLQAAAQEELSLCIPQCSCEKITFIERK
jgi:hypothetical protein